MSSKRQKRGPYRQGKKIPRQTTYNRRLKESGSSSRNSINVVETDTTSTLRQEETQFQVSNFSDTTLQQDNILDTTNPMETEALSTTPHNNTDSDSDQELTAPVDSVEENAENFLYEGCDITSKSASLLIKSYVYRHNLSGQAQTDLLRLLQLLLPKPNTLPKSLYLFRKDDRSSDVITRHYYCSHCFSLVPNSSLSSTCPNEFCRKEFQITSGNFFIQLSIENQLKTLLSRKYKIAYK